MGSRWLGTLAGTVGVAGMILVACYTLLTSRLLTVVPGFYNRLDTFFHEARFDTALSVVQPNSNNVFFVETSCYNKTSEPGGLVLTPRQACAIFSAATINYDRHIYLYYTCPLAHNFYEMTDTTIRHVLKLPNVRVVSAGGDPGLWFQETPLEGLERLLAKSAYPVEHSADAIRILLLWKYSGSYFDMDFVHMKKLKSLGTDWVCAEDPHKAATGAINTGQPEAPILDHMIKEMKNSYRPDEWSSIGPDLITKVIRKLCLIDDTTQLDGWESPYKDGPCTKLRILNHSIFYPISWENWKLYFQESCWYNVSQAITNSYAVHVWNKLSSSLPVYVGSKQPYARLAERYCPEIFYRSKPTF